MRRFPVILRGAFGALLCLAAAGCGGRDAGAPLTFERPETALDYDVVLEGAPSPEVDALLRQSLGLFRQQAEGVQSLAFLRRRATNDEETARRILRSFGYFEGRMLHAVADPAAAPAASGGQAPKPRASVTVTIEPGRPFLLARHGFRVIEDGGEAPAMPAPEALGSPLGAPAAAQAILDAEGAAVLHLRRTGRPYAERRGREAVTDLERAELEVDTTIAAGGLYRMGEPEFRGLDRVTERYLRTWQTWQPGDTFDERRLAEFQRDLVDTNLFDAVAVRPPEEPPEGGTTPVIVDVTEGPRRTVSAGARFSTDRGPAVRGTFEHRNLFGENETVTVEGFAGTDEQRLESRYRVPQFKRNRQDFVAAAGVRHVEFDAYDETAATVTAGLERQLTRMWDVGAGGLAEISETTDSEGRATFLLFGIPLFANYDGTRDFLNPTQGWRVRTDVTPFVGITDDDRTPFFVRLDAVASHYIALDDAANYVLAARARLGAIPAANLEDVPAGRRLYSGGGGSVRGYAERSIGPRDDSNDPTGGLSVVELGTELRARLWRDIGGAVFVEGGSVSEEVYFAFDDLQLATGGGLRYFSPVGPIRFDVGVPLTRRDGDDAFHIYLSIGQAF